MHLSFSRKQSVAFSLFLLFSIGLALFGSWRYAAHAAGASITLSVASGPPATRVEVQGVGFGNAETVMLFLNSSPMKAATTSSTGTFTTAITLPASTPPGLSEISARGQTSGQSVGQGFLVAAPWEQSGFDSSHDGDNVYENLLAPGNVATLTPAWSYKTVNTHYGELAAANGLLYTATSAGELIALNALTGTLVWSHPNSGSGFTEPLVANGLLYTQSGGSVYAFNANTGAAVWTYPAGGNLVVTNGILYIGANALYALNAATGALLWSVQPTSDAFGLPAVSGGILYASADRLYAYNAKTGGLLWTAPTTGDLVVGDGNVYVSAGNTLYALSAKSGALRWSYDQNEGMTDPAVANGIVYVNLHRELVALRAATGTRLWVFTKGKYNNKYPRTHSFTAPVVANGVIYVDYVKEGSDRVFFINATTGALLGSFSKYNTQMSYSTVVDGALYLGSDKIYRFHLPGYP